MAVEIKVPSVGESITEGILSRWLKKEGDAVPQLHGSGREGRITKEDVLTYLEQHKPPAPAAKPPPAEKPKTPEPPPPAPTPVIPGQRETRERISGIRQRIAARLVDAQQT